MSEINKEIIEKVKKAKSVEELKTGELSDEELDNVAGGSEMPDDLLGAYEPYHMCDLWEGKREDIKVGTGCYDCKHSKKSGSRFYICVLPNR